MSIRDSPRSLRVARLFERALRTVTSVQTYRNLLYLLSLFVLGNVYLNVLAVGFGTALSLLVVGIGAVLAVLVLAVVVELAGFERMLLRRLLGVDVLAPAAEADGPRSRRAKRLLTDRRTWTAVAYLLSAFVYGTATFAVVGSLLATAASFLAAPLYYARSPVAAYGPVPNTEVGIDVLFGWDTLLVGLRTTFRFGSWHVETLFGAVLVAGLGAVLAVLALAFCNVAAPVWARYARRMLTTPRYWRL